MALQQLSLESLAKLDLGKGNEAFQRLLRRAIEDCIDRPADKTARKVTLEVSLEPVLEIDLSCTEVKAQIQCTAKVPAYRTKVYSMGARQGRDGAMLVFNEDSPDNVKQGTFTESEDDE